MKTTKEQRIEISDIPYEDQKKYRWVKQEEMQVKGGKWTQKCKCEKTGALGIRRGFFL